MPKVFVATERERQLIAEMVRQVKGSIVNSPLRGSGESAYAEAQDHQAPEVYIAIPIDADGIPAMNRASEGPMAGTDEGTGNNSELDDVPGFGDCAIYRIIHDDPGQAPRVAELKDQKKRVYNLTTSVIPQDWFLVMRDKFGSWFPATSSIDLCSLIKSMPGYDEAKEQVPGHVQGSCQAITIVTCDPPDVGTGSGSGT